MYASASTWMFNAIREVALALHPDQPVTGHFVADVLPDFNSGIHVVKSHAAPIARKLFSRANAIIITTRDPRDAVASLMVHNKAQFDMAVDVTAETAVLCKRYSSTRRAITFRFEDRFFDDPNTLDRIAMTFGGELSGQDRERIYAATRRESIEPFFARGRCQR